MKSSQRCTTIFFEPLFEAEKFPPSVRMFQIRQITAHSSSAAIGNFYRHRSFTIVEIFANKRKL